MVLCQLSYAQNNKSNNDTEGENKVFGVRETMPMYPGGEEGMFNHLRKNLIYPDDALKNGIEGTVYVNFVVGSDGIISNVQVLMGGVYESLDKEAMRVVLLMEKWSPGMLDGVLYQKC